MTTEELTALVAQTREPMPENRDEEKTHEWMRTTTVSEWYPRYDYATKIADAKRLQAEMVADPRVDEVTVTHSHGKIVGITWSRNTIYHCCTASTKAEAICRLWLALKGAEVGR